MRVNDYDLLAWGLVGLAVGLIIGAFAPAVGLPSVPLFITTAVLAASRILLKGRE